MKCDELQTISTDEKISAVLGLVERLAEQVMFDGAIARRDGEAILAGVAELQRLLTSDGAAHAAITCPICGLNNVDISKRYDALLRSPVTGLPQHEITFRCKDCGHTVTGIAPHADEAWELAYKTFRRG